MPIERRTRAPAPSDCSMARKAWRIARGTDMFAGLEGAKKEGGVNERPRKAEVDEFEEDDVVWLLLIVNRSVNGVLCSMDVRCILKASL